MLIIWFTFVLTNILIEMEVNDTYKNFRGEVYVITKISKTGLIVTCTDSNNKECKFRFYDKSGKYIKNGTSTTELGKFIK